MQSQSMQPQSMQSQSIPFPSRPLERGLASFCSLVNAAPALSLALALALLTAAAAPAASAQVATDPVPVAQDPASSSSDVQTPRVLHKASDGYMRDVALLAFAQDTNKTDGNSIRNDATSSGGAMVSYRQSPRWWAGYEASYGYTKYSDAYSKVYRVKHNSNELSLAYLIRSHAYYGFTGFGTLGGGVILFSPSQYGGVVALIQSAPATQTLPLFTYTLGVERAITPRLGVRLQYRDDVYKAPDFKQVPLNTARLRSTSEPAVGVYYRF